MNLVSNKNGQLLTTSKVIADTFGKIHRDVMRSINNLDCSEEFRARNFAQSTYTSPQNKTLDCYEITRDGFSFLCMGFTGKEAAEWKEKYITAFNQLEDALINKSKPSSAMIELNELAKAIESNKDVASVCGKQLAKYKKIKRQDEEAWKGKVEEAQFNLGFKA